MLLDLATSEGADIRFNSIVTEIDSQAISVALQTGEVFHADVIVGADGPASLVRSVVLGEHIPETPDKDLSLSFTIATDAMRDDEELRPLTEKTDVREFVAFNGKKAQHCCSGQYGWVTNICFMVASSYVLLMFFSRAHPDIHWDIPRMETGNLVSPCVSPSKAMCPDSETIGVTNSPSTTSTLICTGSNQGGSCFPLPSGFNTFSSCGIGILIGILSLGLENCWISLGL